MAVIRPLSETLASTRVDLPPDEPLLDVRGLTLSFAGVQAVDGVSFSVRPGELFAIIGPNGAGKTSVFNCVSGFYEAERGDIHFLGDSLRGRDPHEIAAAGVSRMFQNIELFENLSVLDNLMLGRHEHMRYGLFRAMIYAGRTRRDEIEHRQVVEDIIDFLEIESYRKEPCGLLPYGIKKRVELGRALAMEPKLLLLDEPVAGMNVEETEDMARFILDIREELGLTMILVDHDMGVVMDLADRVLVLDFGKSVALGEPADIQEDPAVIRAYLGEEARPNGAAGTPGTSEVKEAP